MRAHLITQSSLDRSHGLSEGCAHHSSIMVVPRPATTPNELRRKRAAETPIDPITHLSKGLVFDVIPRPLTHPSSHAKGEDGGMVGELGRGAAAPPPPVSSSHPKNMLTTAPQKPGADPALFPLSTVYVGNWGNWSINIRVDWVPDLVVVRGRD